MESEQVEQTIWHGWQLILLLKGKSSKNLSGQLQKGSILEESKPVLPIQELHWVKFKH
jgi:hypothetical protein